MSKKTVGFIGVGNMAGAILRGIISKEVLEPSRLRLFDPSQEKTAVFTAMGAKVCAGLSQLLEESDIVFFCVKPQVAPAVLAEAAQLPRRKEQLYVSIVAGKNAEFFFSYLGECKLILTMPNTPLLLGKGATAIGEGYHIAPEEFDFVERIFVAAGTVRKVPVEMLNTAIAVNGSTPAFLYRFCKVIADHAQEMGMDRQTAVELFAATMAGSAEMILSSGHSLERLIEMVSSPGGTTLAGLASLDDSGFDQSIVKCMDACVKRAYELGK